ncbi:hypothetical protein D3C80_1897790 [compost metagenome]
MTPTTPSGWYTTLAEAGMNSMLTARREGFIHFFRRLLAYWMPCSAGITSANRVSSAARLPKSAEMAATSRSRSLTSTPARLFSHWMRCPALGMGLARKAWRCRASRSSR